MGPWERKTMVLKKRAFRRVARSGRLSSSAGPLRGREERRMPSPHQKTRPKQRTVRRDQATA